MPSPLEHMSEPVKVLEAVGIAAVVAAVALRSRDGDPAKPLG